MSSLSALIRIFVLSGNRTVSTLYIYWKVIRI